MTEKGSNDEGRMTNEEGRDRQMTKEQQMKEEDFIFVKGRSTKNKSL